jgi:hypothetical protein
MGWNSWDAYGTTVTEAQIKANADAMADKLMPFGWQYIVIDIQWYAAAAAGHDYRPGETLTLDEYGRLTPAVNRFPSAAEGRGFRPLADYIHGKGLTFGIHIMRGIPRQAVDRNLPIKGTQYHAAVGIATKDPVVRDLWERKDIGPSRTLAVRLRPHASVLYRVTGGTRTGAPVGL